MSESLPQGGRAMGRQGTRAVQRVAIYARYSSDMQNDRSIEDQFAVCEAYARKNGWSVTARFADRAASGGSDFGRRDYARMVVSAERGDFAIALAEDIDRLSRNMANISQLFEGMNFAGVQIWTVADGQINEMHIGLKGTMSALFLKNLAAHVKRGMAGVTREGRSAGGDIYGYTAKAGERGVLEINPEKATIVRRIFQEYVEGSSPRTIAASLNHEGVAAPRGSHWNASTINGSAARGLGILFNEKYAGRIVWNRTRKMKDPRTGKRVSRQNPKSEWTSIEATHLRIVDDALFEAARERKRKTSGDAARHAPRSKRILSGLLKCGACGGGMTIIGHDKSGPRVQCAAHREGKSCGNGARYYIEKIESLVLGRLAQDLDNPTMLAAHVRTYVGERRARAQKSRRDRTKLEGQLASTSRAIASLVDAIADGTLTKDEVGPRLERERAEKARVSTLLASIDEDRNVVELHPTALARFRDNVATLKTMTDGGVIGMGTEAASLFRELVHSVEVAPRAASEPYRVELKGHLSAVLGGEVWPSRQVGYSGGAG